MLETVLYIALVPMIAAMVLFFIRTIIGPSPTDRVLGLDSFGVTLIGFIGIIMILQDTIAYSDIILVISILSFVGTVALSKFIERGAVFDRD